MKYFCKKTFGEVNAANKIRFALNFVTCAVSQTSAAKAEVPASFATQFFQSSELTRIKKNGFIKFIRPHN